ncbi:fimbrial protein [Rahnella sp. EDr1-12]|uniref:fimbrial protein n=1 Tax=unclassified Rahnella TaxID=2635087 RepID=UPI003BAA7ACD
MIKMIILMFTVSISFSLTVKAEDNFSLKGTLLEPPKCGFNGGLQTLVEFGNRVGVNKVDGINYKQKIPYLMFCEAESKPWDMAFILTGITTSYDGAAIQTNIDDLGIRLLINGKPFSVGKLVPIDFSKPPLLEAVPVKRPGSTLTAGAFEAVATIGINYQ